MARPTKYEKRFAELMLKYFSVKPYIIKGNRRIPSDFPTLAGFAVRIGVHRDTLHKWANEDDDKPEFADVYARVPDFQENWLVTNGLHDLVQTAFGIFTAKNVLNWRDKKDVEHSGKGGGPINFSNLTDEQLEAKIQEQLAKREKK